VADKVAWQRVAGFWAGYFGCCPKPAASFLLSGILLLADASHVMRKVFDSWRHFNENRSALCSTSRFGFAGWQLGLLRLLEVSLVLASWRVVLHCSWRNAPSALRLACCARGRVVLYRSRGRPPSPPSPLRSASPLRLALLCA
jgi:hypothetical protein